MLGGNRGERKFFFSNIVFVLCCVAFGFLKNNLIFAAQVGLKLNMTRPGYY